MKIIKAIQTCAVCPAQFDAWDETGQYYYFRHRSGWARIYKLANEEDSLADGDLIAEMWTGHHLDGGLDFRPFCKMAGIEIAEDADLQLIDLSDYDSFDDPPWYP